MTPKCGSFANCLGKVNCLEIFKCKTENQLNNYAYCDTVLKTALYVRVSHLRKKSAFTEVLEI